jgi:gentisate 1,2-dioxygenase
VDTTSSTRASGVAEPRLEQFLQDVEQSGAQPLWALKTPVMSPTPRPATRPWQWYGADLRSLCERARELVPLDAGGDRRVLTLANPGLGGLPFATATVSCAYQTLAGHEVVPAHRHTPAALRFILEGSGVWTTVDGDSFEMNAGDLVLTPSWAFHDHRNESDRTMTWFDGLDLPLVRGLDAIFYEPAPVSGLPREEVERSARRYLAPGVLAEGEDRPTASSRLLVYRWGGTDRALDSLLGASDLGHAVVRFTDPGTSSSALPTIGCRMLRIARAGYVPPVRRTGSSVFVIFRGSGRSVVDGVAYEWNPGDVIAVPSWSAVEHHSDDGADIFLMSDDPVLRILGLYREEALEAPQAVTGRFDAEHSHVC